MRKDLEISMDPEDPFATHSMGASLVHMIMIMIMPGWIFW